MTYIKRILPFFIVLLTAAFLHADVYQSTIDSFKQAPESKGFFKDAYGYAVFPNIGKGGVGIGGAFGKGQVYKKGKVTGSTSLTQLSIGLQLGGKSYSEMIFFQDERAFNDFTSGNFEFGANASAIAITASAQAQAGTEGATASANSEQAKNNYTKGMAVFIRGKGGLMYEASISGQKFSYKANP